MDEHHPIIVAVARAILLALEVAARVVLTVWMLLEAARDYLGGTDA